MKHRRASNAAARSLSKVRDVSSNRADEYDAGRAPHLGVTPATQTSWERLTATAAAWSQVGMLAVVTIGYFATVRPAFQKEQLSEDVARLEIERRSLETKLSEIERRLDLGTQNVATIERERSDLLVSVEQLRKNEALAKEGTLSAIQSADKARQVARAARDDLDVARTHAYEMLVNEVTGRTSMSHLSPVLTEILDRDSGHDIFDRERGTEIAARLRTAFRQPIDLAKDVLKELKAMPEQSQSAFDKQLSQRLVTDFEAGLAKHVSDLTCQVPDFDEWQRAFEKALRAASERRGNCSDHQFNRLARANNWSPAKLDAFRKSPVGQEQHAFHERACSSAIDRTVERVFTKQWSANVAVCDDRRFGVSGIVMGQQDLTELKPMLLSTASEPPTTDAVVKSVDDMIDAL